MRAHFLRLAHSNLHPNNQIGTYLGKQRVHTQRSEKPTNEKAGNAKKRTRTEATAFMASSKLVFVDDSGTPYQLIQNEPTPAPIKPTFSTKDQDDANTLTQITEDLVALHIVHNPKFASATMLVDPGASHSTMPISLSILRAPASLH